MVKNKLKIFLTILLTGIICFAGSCRIDILGLFMSTPLDERMKERNSFKFLTQDDLSPSFGEEYSFIVLADTHIEDSNAWGLEKLEVVIRNNREIKFTVVLGDITQYGDEKDIEKFIETARSFGIPCYPVIGNHDIYFGNWSVWKKHIGSACYKVDGGSTTLFILDSANTYFGKEQLDWLESEIRKTSGRVFVFTHANLFIGEFINIQQKTDYNERARVLSILKNKCDAMFMGHSHERVIENIGGVDYVNIEDFVDAKVYCIVSVTKTGINYDFRILY